MFAFSEIIASGENVMAIASQMDKEIASRPKKDKGLDEDQAIAAFAESLNQEEASVDPKLMQAQKQKKK